MSTTGTPPKVFISYSWTDDAHLKWVETLATTLRADGVDATLDRWDLHAGNDKFAFMEKIVTDPDVKKVLVICDKVYAEKAARRTGGVGTESQLIAPHVYSKPGQEKFIPLVRDRGPNGETYLPPFFLSTTYIDFSNNSKFESSYEELIRNIFAVPSMVKPPLGSPPAFLSAPAPATTPPSVATQITVKFNKLRDAVFDSKPFAQTLLQEYLDEFVSGLEQFRVNEMPRAVPDYDEYVIRSITAFIPYRDQFVDFIFFVAGYMDDDQTRAKIAACLGKVLEFSDRPVSVMSWSEVMWDNYRFIAYELFVYVVASFIKAEKYRTASYFMEHTYTVAKNLGGSDYYEVGCHLFDQGIDSLDQDRKKRLKLTHPSVSAFLMQERATYSKLKAKDLFQADFIIFLRQFFPNRGEAADWYPRCACFLARGGPLELFSKAANKQGFDAMKELFQVKTPRQLAETLSHVGTSSEFDQACFESRLLKATFPTVFNIQAIARSG